jgi:hypothetical protein
MRRHIRVCGGLRTTDDEGYIHSITRNEAMVGWDAGVRTPVLIRDLKLAPKKSHA